MPKQKTPLILAAALTLVAFAPAVAQEQMEQPQQTIIAALEQTGQHATLIEAIRTAGLEETLQGEGPYTIFAPTDEAFAKLSEEKRSELMANPEVLREVLSFHVASRSISSADVTEPINVETLQGSSVQVVRDGETLRLQAPAPAAEVGGVEAAEAPGAITATVVSPDIAASNGVIHAVDTVLLIEG